MWQRRIWNKVTFSTSLCKTQSRSRLHSQTTRNHKHLTNWRKKFTDIYYTLCGVCEWQKPSERWWIWLPARGMTSNRPKIYSDHMKGFPHLMSSHWKQGKLWTPLVHYSYFSSPSFSRLGVAFPSAPVEEFPAGQNSVPRGDYPMYLLPVVCSVNT